MKKKIYVAGLYGRRRGLSLKHCEENVKEAIKVTRRLIELGWNPFVPHLHHYIHKGWLETLKEEEWFQICSEWIGDCEAIYMMKGYKESEGAMRELEIAQNLGLQIYYEDMKDRY